MTLQKGPTSPLEKITPLATALPCTQPVLVQTLANHQAACTHSWRTLKLLGISVHGRRHTRRKPLRGRGETEKVWFSWMGAGQTKKHGSSQDQNTKARDTARAGASTYLSGRALCTPVVWIRRPAVSSSGRVLTEDALLVFTPLFFLRCTRLFDISTDGKYRTVLKGHTQVSLHACERRSREPQWPPPAPSQHTPLSAASQARDTAVMTEGGLVRAKVGSTYLCMQHATILQYLCASKKRFFLKKIEI